MQRSWALLAVLAAVAVVGCSAGDALSSSVSFYIPFGATKCLREEVHKDVLVVVEYTLMDMPGVNVELKVTDTPGHIVYRKPKMLPKGKFVFTPDDYDQYSICLISAIETPSKVRPDLKQEVTLSLRQGVEARNYEEMAEAQKLKPIEVELRRMEDLAETIVGDFQYMRKREEEMRNTNESTNERVMWFTVLSMMCLLGLAVWQVYYLKRFFQAKKLI